MEPELALADTGVTDTATTVDPMTSANAATTVTEEMAFMHRQMVKSLQSVKWKTLFFHKNDGDGYAVRPSNGKIYAPVAGWFQVFFETKHAIGILTPGGAEVLVHMGLDTVELKGAPFTSKCRKVMLSQ